MYSCSRFYHDTLAKGKNTMRKLIITAPMPATVVISEIMTAAEREGKAGLVTIDKDGDKVTVTINKLGTSRLEFKQTAQDQTTRLELVEESISFAHRAFIGGIIDWLSGVIKSMGGAVEA